jgi:FKBP-type peptidyl-prolyl cis-trans isomerase FklB
MRLIVTTFLGVSLLCANANAAYQQTTSQTSAVQTPGEEFLAKNKNKPGVVTLPDGLEYKVIVEGKGATPTDNDIVKVHYEGKLVNGTEFDSSYKRGEPVSFPVTGVIPGWTEALKLMKVGSIWELYIPSALAYGEQGMPPVIGPNETLIFKVELIEIKKQ